jgi:hypothetical protein
MQMRGRRGLSTSEGHTAVAMQLCRKLRAQLKGTLCGGICGGGGGGVAPTKTGTNQNRISVGFTLTLWIMGVSQEAGCNPAG